MSVELHSQGPAPGAHTCSECKQGMEAHWHCPACGDYNLCTNCYTTKGHTHKMAKVGLGLDEEATGGDEGGHQGELLPRSPGESLCQSVQRCIQALVHVCRCLNANCSQTGCQKMKRLVRHSRGCQRKNNGGCPVCKQLIALCCYHAKQCQENPCPVPFCLHIKQKLPRSSSAPAGSGSGSGSGSASR